MTTPRPGPGPGASGGAFAPPSGFWALAMRFAGFLAMACIKLHHFGPQTRRVVGVQVLKRLKTVQLDTPVGCTTAGRVDYGASVGSTGSLGSTRSLRLELDRWLRMAAEAANPSRSAMAAEMDSCSWTTCSKESRA